MTILHHRTLFNGMRRIGDIVQDGTLGLQAAALALAINDSYFQNKPIQ